MMILCSDCKHHERLAQGAVCRSPELASLAAMVDGTEAPGSSADCIDARLNGNLCGIEARWFEQAPTPEPEPKAESHGRPPVDATDQARGDTNVPAREGVQSERLRNQ